MTAQIQFLEQEITHHEKQAKQANNRTTRAAHLRMASKHRASVELLKKQARVQQTLDLEPAVV